MLPVNYHRTEDLRIFLINTLDERQMLKMNIFSLSQIEIVLVQCSPAYSRFGHVTPTVHQKSSDNCLCETFPSDEGAAKFLRKGGGDEEHADPLASNS